MASADHRRFARKQLRELKDDVDDLEGRLKHDSPSDDRVTDACNAIRRLIENRTLDLSPLVRADD